MQFYDRSPKTSHPLAALSNTQAGDTMHILHVIAPSRRLVVTPDMGLEGVIEDDEETRRQVVSCKAAHSSSSTQLQQPLPVKTTAAGLVEVAAAKGCGPATVVLDWGGCVVMCVVLRRRRRCCCCC
jgi:hypothetical protein